MFSQIVYQPALLLFGKQPVGLASEGWCLDGRLYPAMYNPMEYSGQVGRTLPQLRVFGPLRHSFILEPRRPRDPARSLFGGDVQGCIVEMRVDCSRLVSSVAEDRADLCWVLPAWYSQGIGWHGRRPPSDCWRVWCVCGWTCCLIWPQCFRRRS